MSEKTYYIATVSSSELDFEAKATDKEGRETENSIGATLIFNLGGVYEQHNLRFRNIIKKTVQTNGNIMIKSNTETRQMIMRQLNSEKFRQLLKTINGGKEVRLSFAPVIHVPSEITEETVQESS